MSKILNINAKQFTVVLRFLVGLRKLLLICGCAVVSNSFKWRRLLISPSASSLWRKWHLHKSCWRVASSNTVFIIKILLLNAYCIRMYKFSEGIAGIMHWMSKKGHFTLWRAPSWRLLSPTLSNVSVTTAAIKKKINAELFYAIA